MNYLLFMIVMCLGWMTQLSTQHILMHLSMLRLERRIVPLEVVEPDTLPTTLTIHPNITKKNTTLSFSMEPQNIAFLFI